MADGIHGICGMDRGAEDGWEDARTAGQVSVPEAKRRHSRPCDLFASLDRNLLLHFCSR